MISSISSSLLMFVFSAPMTPDYALVKTVCDSIKTTDAYKAITQDTNSFRSSIRGLLTETLSPPLYLTESGFRRYDLTMNDYFQITVDLYTCTHRDPLKKYLLSHGYKYDTRFFLFAFNGNTNEVELKGWVYLQSDFVPSQNYVQGVNVESKQFLACMIYRLKMFS